jgi:four helix bundle protein
MKNIIIYRTKMLALSVIMLVSTIPRTDISTLIIRQLVRSATSVGANYRAALRGRSKADFISKMNIAEEEADETLYWLEILADANLTDKSALNTIYREANEITAILTATGKTARLNQRK